jgi:tetratricopeptide (TPR) repeat protein
VASLKDKYLDSAQKFIAKGQYDKAIGVYHDLLKIDPDIRNRQRLAELLVKAGFRDEAVEEYQAVVRYYSDNHFFLKAIAVLKQIQKLAPENISITLSLAELNQKQGLIGNSLSEYQIARAYYEKRGNLIDAVTVLEKMLELDPGNLNIRLALAERRVSIGKREQALEDFRLVAESVRQQGDTSLFRQIASRMEDLFPGQGLDPLAELEARLQSGESAAVIPALQKLATASPGSRVIQLLLEASRRAGDRAAFKSACLLAIGHEPDDPGPREGLLRLVEEEDGPEPAVRLLEEWAYGLVSRGQGPLLQALCHSIAPRVVSVSGLLDRLSQMDPSLAPPPPSPVLPSDEARAPVPPPTEGNDPVESPSASSPVEDHWEEDLHLGLPVAGHQEETLELMELECFEEEDIDGDLLLEPEEDVALEPEAKAGEELVGITLSHQALSRQNWEPPAAVDQPLTVAFEEVSDGLLEMEEGDLLKGQPLSGTGGQLFEGGAESLFSEDELEDGQWSPDLPVELGDKLGDGAAKHSIDGLFTQSKMTVDDQVERGDTETYFNLGIAYKEMGLYDDAMEAFKTAAHDPARRVDCLVLQGICCRETGDLVASERILRSGATECQPDSEGACVLLYELGLLYEIMGKDEDALEAFQQVRKANPAFRDVAERVARLGGGDEAYDLLEMELLGE